MELSDIDEYVLSSDSVDDSYFVGLSRLYLNDVLHVLTSMMLLMLYKIKYSTYHNVNEM